MINKVCFIFDVESAFYKLIPSPTYTGLKLVKWKIFSLFSKFLYAHPPSKGLKNLVQTFKEYNEKATFCICGYLYLKNFQELSSIGFPNIKSTWYENNLNKKWGHWARPNSKYNKDLFLGEFIEKIANSKLFELGLHGFSHEALVFEDKDTVDKIIKKAVLSAKKRGIKVCSFVAPFNMVRDSKGPEKVFSALLKNKIRIAQDSHQDKRFYNYRTLKLIKPDAFFEKTSSKTETDMILEKMSKNKGLFVLSSHDFSWRNTKNLRRILNFIKKNKIKTIHMKDIK